MSWIKTLLDARRNTRICLRCQRAGNKTLAARILGFDRKTLYNKLERYAVEKVPAQRRT